MHSRRTVPQSALEVRGPGAGAIADIWWPMLAAGTVIFLLVAAIVLYLPLRKQPRKSTRSVRVARRWIVMGGVVLPVLVLVPLFLASVRTLRTLMLHDGGGGLTIHVTGHQWWWDIRYEDPAGVVVAANEIHIPAGRRVRLELRTADVIHSLWVPNLHGKTDLVPGRTNVTWIEATEAGVFRAQCAEYCGTQHALMALPVVAETPAAFDAWLARERLPAGAPVSAAAIQGASRFVSAGCGTCHAIRGTNAGGTRGPDLTHFASRRTLAAGTLDNTPRHVTRWLSDPQAVKPGNRMPRSSLSAVQLGSIVSYLGTLH